ncbi:clathrin light chain B-like isoform 3-T3 [Molossus nigricans]
MGLATDLNKALPLGEGHGGGTSGTHVETLGAKWASEEAFVKESKEETPGTEWEKVAQLCDFNPKSSKQCKDVSRLRSVLMSLKQTPLSR